MRYPNKEATEIVRNLLGKNYQEYYELAFSLAGMGDVATLDWARELMKTPDEDRWMAYYALAFSTLPKADTLARRVIAGNDPKDLVILIQGYKESQNPNRFGRLRDVINSDNKDPDVKLWLRITLKEMADEGSGQAAELLKRLQN